MQMGSKINEGRTFHRSTTPNGKRHLWITLTNPDPDKVVVVNLTTLRPGRDTTVILFKGEHRFIQHDSVVFFADAQFATVENIQQAVKQNLADFDEDCSPEVLEKIQKGLLTSPATPPEIKNYCQTQFFF